MHIPVNAIRIAQRHLKSSGFKPGKIDGDLGPKTEKALDRVLKARRDELHPNHTDAIRNGSRRRKFTAYIQLLATDVGIDAGAIDGFWGPQTDFVFGEIEHLEEHGERRDPFRDLPPADSNPNNWPVQRSAGLTAFYGRPGTESNLVLVDVPYPHRLAWDLSTTVSRVRVHKKVADSLDRVLNRVVADYGLGQIKNLRLDHYGGSYNKRRMRGGTSWSTHAWGIALDYDPANNRLRWGRDRATFAHPEYEAWWNAWEEEGWLSLGRARNFDWMHVQAARLP